LRAASRHSPRKDGSRAQGKQPGQFFCVATPSTVGRLGEASSAQYGGETLDEMCDHGDAAGFAVSRFSDLSVLLSGSRVRRAQTIAPCPR
jgi:hypothetical protein